MTKRMWAVIDAENQIVHWQSKTDGEEGHEIHKTKKIAKSYAMGTERVVPCLISWHPPEVET